MSNLIGIKVAIALREPLYSIKHWCEVNSLPPLTVIVVNQKTGKPGSGLALAYPDQARVGVFNDAWYRLVPPVLLATQRVVDVVRTQQGDLAGDGQDLPDLQPPKAARHALGFREDPRPSRWGVFPEGVYSPLPSSWQLAQGSKVSS